MELFYLLPSPGQYRTGLHLNHTHYTVDDVVILPSHVFTVGWCVRPHQLVQVEGVETTAPLGLRPRKAMTSTKRVDR